ncbi:MAG: helicase C-terminal domain-containing protein [Thermoanaerobaculia bacterium]
MPPRFDSSNLILELSVGDLVDASLARHLGFANRGGHERLWLGQAIHSRYQEAALAADPTYQREVPVSATFAHRGWQISVHGRIDGLRRDTDQTMVVEEIKSLRRGSRPSAALREIYAKQALLYAWILRRGGETKVAAELVWIEIGTDVVEHEPLDFSFAAMDGAARKRINALLREFDSQKASLARRRVAADRLTFPYDAERPGQETILESVEQALLQGDHLLVEAPTGIGKTVAALLPALRYALASDKKIFVLTAKTLQQEMATQVLKLLTPDDNAFASLRLRAKAKMCANDQLLCHEEYCRFAKEYYSKLHGSGLVPELLAAGGLLLPDRIFDNASRMEVCPFEVSLELTSKVQVVVCDYNYAFDPYVGLSDFHAENDLSNTILVIDEIHNLVGRGRDYYSPSLSSRQARLALEFIQKGTDAVHRSAARLCRELADLIDRTVDVALEDAPGQARATEAQLPEADLWALRPAFDETFIGYLEHRKETSSFRPDDPFVDLYFTQLRFLDGLMLSTGEAFSHCVETASEGGTLKVLCKDPSAFLGQVLNRTHSAIGLSATLSPTEFYRDLLGFDRERTSSLSVPSPFPAENRQVVIDDSVATLWRKRPENYPRIADRLAAFAEAVPGNCLALFPSYQFLNEVAQRLGLESKRVLIQHSAGTDQERNEILESLRSALAGDVLLMAVAGGVFAEGVDYPGDMLKAVAVVGPCLPAVSLEQELLKRYYDERFERGFEYAFVVPGMTRVVQAAGRLIRSAGDTGVIALLDERFLLSPYRDHLPADWLANEGPEGLIGVPGQVATKFFSSPPGRSGSSESES